MDATGLIGTFIGLVHKRLAGRQRIVLTLDTGEQVIASFYPYDDASTVVSRTTEIRIYNGGPGRVTVNRAGWEAQDGTRIEAHVPSASTLEPGGKELVATGDPWTLVQVHDDRGGLARMYVELAGEKKPRREKVAADWIPKVRALAERDGRRAG